MGCVCGGGVWDGDQWVGYLSGDGDSTQGYPQLCGEFKASLSYVRP